MLALLPFLHSITSLKTALFSANQNRVIFSCILLGDKYTYGGRNMLFVRSRFSSRCTKFKLWNPRVCYPNLGGKSIDTSYWHKNALDIWGNVLTARILQNWFGIMLMGYFSKYGIQRCMHTSHLVCILMYAALIPCLPSWWRRTETKSPLSQGIALNSRGQNNGDEYF